MADNSGLKFRVVTDSDVPTPASGKVQIYFTSSGARYKTDDGVAHSFPSVGSFNGRNGAITPLQADYDSFFLTVAEGDALYDAIGAAAAAQAASQPLDATLTALAAQNWVANAVPLGTGADTVTQLSITANTLPARSSSGNVTAKSVTDFGLSLIDDVDATAARSTLGLGTAATQNVGAFDAAGAAAAAQAASQPLDTTLTALAAANWAANALPIGTGIDTLSQTVFAVNTLPARSSSGNLVAKSITDYAITTLFGLSGATALTAAVNVATTVLSGALSSTDKLKLDNLPFFNVKDYGAKGDDITAVATGSMTSGLATLTMSAATFTGTSDEGKTIVVEDAGNAGATLPLRTTILTYISSTQVTLATTALASVSTKQVAYWTNDSTSVQNAINAAEANLGGFVVFPPGRYALHTGLINDSHNVTFLGSGAAYTADAGDSTRLGGSWLVFRGTSSGIILLDASPTTGASNPALKGFRVFGLSFDGRNLPQGTRGDTGLRLRSAHGWHIEDTYYMDFQTVAVDFGTLANGSIGEAHDCTRGKMTRFCIRQIDDDSASGAGGIPGIGIRMDGNVALLANTCCNVFDTGQIMYHGGGTGPGVEMLNSDSNTMINVLCNRATATTTNPGWRINGHASSASGVARNNVFYNCSYGLNGVAFTNPGNPTIDTYIHDLQVGNGEPLPGVAPGVTANGVIVYWNANGTQSGGTFSTFLGNSEVGTRNTASATVAAALVDITGLAFPLLQPGEKWQFDCEVFALPSATIAGGVGVAVNLPAGATLMAMATGSTASSTSAERRTYFTAVNASQSSFIATTSTGQIRLSGVVVVGTATTQTGSFQVRANCVATATLQANCFLRAIRIT